MTRIAAMDSSRIYTAKELAKIDSKVDRIDHLAAKIFLDSWMENHVNSD